MDNNGPGIAGDFNIHINNLDTDDDGSTFLESIEAMGYNSMILNGKAILWI